LVLLAFVIWRISPRIHAASKRVQDQLATLSSRAQENFAGVRVVKSFAQEDHEVASFGAVARRYLDENLGVARLSAWMQPVVGGVGDVSLLSLLLAGGLLILGGLLQFSDLIEFTGYQYLLLWPMISIGWIINQYLRGRVSVERLREILARRPLVEEPAAPAAPPGGAIEGTVSIRGLTFAYGGTTVLRDVSIEVPRGATVAIVGRTGAGKSTLVSLIARLHPVPDGAIFVDGVDVNRLPLGLLRRAIGFVPQESFLFSRTLGENLAFGADEARQDEVRAAAALTRLDKDLDQFPRGFDEIVGERGVTLSGGQKQRAAIGRALLIRPRILILDDALSAVDTSTEEEIVANLKRFTRDLTTIIVSHRISSIRHADRIYVLDEGHMAEEGTHDELLRRGGLYAEMHRLQLISDELARM
jgi:ATP-binding cassette subfamily B protein